MSIRGIFASHSGIVGERVGDLSSRVLVMGYTGTAPLLALSSGMPKEVAGDTSYSWVEDSHISGNTTATNAVNAQATSFNVADASIWTKNTVLMNQTTGEYMLVTDIVGNTITAMRGVGGTVAAAIAIGNVFQHIGTAYPEGGGKPNPVTQKGESRTNYVQIFKNGWAITGTAKAVKFHTGSQLAYNRSQALGYHVEDLERSFIFGRPMVTHINGQQLRMSGGIQYQIETYGGLVEMANSGGVAGNLSVGDLMGFINRIFERNVKGMPNERVTFTGTPVLSVIQELVMEHSHYNISVNESAYGIKVMKLIGVNGELSLATHPLFNENPIWGHQLHVYHPGLIKKRVLRDTWEETFGGGSSNNNGIDAEEGYIAIEQGWQAQGVETMGILKNIQTAYIP